MSPIRLPQLDAGRPGVFPPAESALHEPEGLLAWGGELSPIWLLSAYRQGIFPWYNPGEPILWWSPDPRYGFVPGTVHLGRSRQRLLRRMDWRVRADTAFDAVVRHCAEVPRGGQAGTWIDDAMRTAYGRMHALGFGHSIEVFEGEALVGGLYGLAIGRVFFAESMFGLRSQASALALYALSRTLADWGWRWLDAQLHNPHLALLGGRAMARTGYLRLLAEDTALPGRDGPWSEAFPGRPFGDYAG